VVKDRATSEVRIVSPEEPAIPTDFQESIEIPFVEWRNDPSVASTCGAIPPDHVEQLSDLPRIERLSPITPLPAARESSVREEHATRRESNERAPLEEPHDPGIPFELRTPQEIDFLGEIVRDHGDRAMRLVVTLEKENPVGVDARQGKKVERDRHRTFRAIIRRAIDVIP
jgi:hypothetical protein